MTSSALTRFTILAFGLLLQAGVSRLAASGAAGDVDPSFDAGSGLDGGVSAVAVQPDGKVIIAGQFTMVKGLMRSKFARLNADGTGDGTFRGSINGLGAIGALALQPGGNVLVAHTHGLAGFDSDGLRGFEARATNDDGFSQAVSVIAVQPDGRILIGGNFTMVNGTPRRGIARLHADGGLDHTFDPGAGIQGDFTRVQAIAVQTDGRILMGGLFPGFNGTPRNNIARLKPDGSLDRTFFPGSGADDNVYALVAQPDGKVLVGGEFSTFDGTPRRRLARLHGDGSLDHGFEAGAASGAGVFAMALQPDGKVLVRGIFDGESGPDPGMVRLHPDGSLDRSLDPGRAGYVAYHFSLQADGKFLIGGTDRNGLVGLARLHADGSLDPAFQPDGGVRGRVRSVASQPDGKVLIGGDFAFINGVSRRGVARLHANGSLDAGFLPAPGINPLVHQIRLQPDGRVLVGGYSTTDDFEGTVRGGITRLHADGSLDLSFIPGSGANGTVGLINLQADGKILIGGHFDAVDGASRPGIARLHADGSLDTGFNPDPDGIPISLLCLVPQPDGKVLAGSYGNALENGAIRGGLTRFNADGSLDGTFNSGRGGYVRAIALLPDGGILIGGYFSTVEDVTRFTSLARLHANGSLDSRFQVPEAFHPGAGVLPVSALTLQPDGRILGIGAYYLGVDSEGNDDYLSGYRLNADGSLDRSFYAALTGGVMELLPDGRLFVGGGDLIGSNIGRLLGDPVAPSLDMATSEESAVLSWPAGAWNLQLQETTDLSLPASWSAVPQPPVAKRNRLAVTVPMTGPQRFFRLVSP